MRRLFRFLTTALAVLGLAMVLVTLTPIDTWWAGRLSGPWYEPKGDVLIVFGADPPDSGFIGPVTYWRSFYTVRAWREGGFQAIVVSGGNGVAESIRELLAFGLVPPGKSH